MILLKVRDYLEDLLTKGQERTLIIILTIIGYGTIVSYALE